MEQLYMIEIFIDTVAIFVDENETSTANKNLICKVKFGPNVQLLIKEDTTTQKDDVIEYDEETKQRKFVRTIRVGKSYLFPSYPDTMLEILHNFPLEIEVWNDDEKEENNIFVGFGTMYWDTQFFVFLKDTSDVCKMHEPLSIKSRTPLKAECCCVQCGEIAFIVRVSALGSSIITEFLQLMSDPDQFLFATNKAPSKFQVKRIEGDDVNFTMIGSLYESATLEDPDVIALANKKIEVCTELQSCGVASGKLMGQSGADTSCTYGGDEDQKVPKTYPIQKIKMGDITGPCGNPNCKLAHKVKMYIRTLDAYKKEYNLNPEPVNDPGKVTKKVCGSCGCKDDKWHREACSENSHNKSGGKSICKACGGLANDGSTCAEIKTKLHNTGVTPTASRTAPPAAAAGSPAKPNDPIKTQVNYVLSVTRDPDLMESMFGKDFITQTTSAYYDCDTLCNKNQENSSGEANCKKPASAINVSIREKEVELSEKTSSPTFGQSQTFIYNVDTSDSKRRSEKNFQIFNCLAIPDDKDCKCAPPVPTPVCGTADCECVQNLIAERSRKKHKSHCPLYKHKINCPVTMLNENEELNEFEEVEPEAEPLPYGLPPIRLGPCPVMGRPCSVPDGFARMYKINAMPPQPPSYSDAGKVCCSKEFERIKKAIKEYMKNEKPSDFRCINKFNIDTEKRCCDKENFLLSLMGKDCCGPHKISIQDKFKFATDLPGQSGATGQPTAPR